jgi:hypothetical protein
MRLRVEKEGEKRTTEQAGKEAAKYGKLLQLAPPPLSRTPGPASLHGALISSGGAICRSTLPHRAGPPSLRAFTLADGARVDKIVEHLKAVGSCTVEASISCATADLPSVFEKCQFVV